MIQGEFDFLAKIEDFEQDNLKNSHIYYRETECGGYDVYVSGDYAYIADDWKGLAIIDISDPTSPGAPIYEDIPSGWAQAVYVSGNYAYVAYTGMTKNGLAIIYVLDPENPVLVANVYTECAWDVYISGNYAYIADDNNGLAIIDISDPTIPVSTANITTYGVANGVYVSGNYAYVADGNAGLTVIDVSDPTSPGIAANEDTDGYAQAVYVSGDDAFVADGSAGLVFINVQNPTNPGTPYYEDTYGAVDVVITGDYAYTVDIYGMGVFNINFPPFPNEIVYKDIDGYTRGVCIEGNYAYISGSVGLAVVDISKNIDPLLIDNEITMGEANQVYIDGNYAFIADYDQGLAVVDIFDPTSPATVINMNTTDYAWDVDVDGNYAYVASGYSGLAVIDIKNPTSPGAPIYIDIGLSSAQAVDISGDYAYLADGLEGLKVIDISDPTTPVLAGQMDTDGYATDVKIDGDYAYMSIGAYGLAIIDITDPTTPGSPIYIDTVFYAHAVDISGDYAFIAEFSDVHGGVLNVIDISNPLIPVLLSRIGTIGPKATDVFVSGNYAYIASSDRLTVIDLKWDGTGSYYTDSDPIDECVRVYVEGDYAYVASRSEGLVVVKIRERADLDDPIITVSPSDLILECGYTEERISWTATDANPNTFTVELQGSGIVAGPNSWSNGIGVHYHIPDGLAVGTYTYTINFTDDNGNFATDTVEVTVQDTENPVIIFTPGDKIVGLGYAGVNFQWTATDENPYNYTIELQGSGNVVDSTTWSSGIPIIYNVPEGFGLGEYFYTINFTDDYGHFITDTVKFTVEDIEDPMITDAPSDIAVELGYTGVNLQWTATDDNPNTYTIELQGSGIVAGPTAWSSGVAVNYGIPDGFSLGEYYYIINYSDDYDNFVIDTVKFTVGDTINPVITDVPEDFSCFSGYSDVCLFWIATDAHPATFTVEHQGHGIVVGPTPWTSGNNVSCTIPEGLSVGDHFFTINFTDLAGNFATDTVKITIQEETPPVEPPPSGIPFGNTFLVFMTISIIGLVLIQRKKK